MDSRPFDVKTKPTGPFDLYSLNDPHNPKNKEKTPLIVVIGQSEEPHVSALGGLDVPSSSQAPSFELMVVDIDNVVPPSPIVSASMTSPVPMPIGPLFALQII